MSTRDKINCSFVEITQVCVDGEYLELDSYRTGDLRDEYWYVLIKNDCPNIDELIKEYVYEVLTDYICLDFEVTEDSDIRVEWQIINLPVLG